MEHDVDWEGFIERHIMNGLLGVELMLEYVKSENHGVVFIPALKDRVASLLRAVNDL